MLNSNYSIKQSSKAHCGKILISLFKTVSVITFLEVFKNDFSLKAVLGIQLSILGYFAFQTLLCVILTKSVSYTIDDLSIRVKSGVFTLSEEFTQLSKIKCVQQRTFWDRILNLSRLKCSVNGSNKCITIVGIHKTLAAELFEHFEEHSVENFLELYLRNKAMSGKMNQIQQAA